MDNLTQYDGVDELLLDALLDQLRLEGNVIELTRFKRRELADDGLPASDLKRAIRLAGERRLIMRFSNCGVPCIAFVQESEVAA